MPSCGPSSGGMVKVRCGSGIGGILGVQGFQNIVNFNSVRRVVCGFKVTASFIHSIKLTEQKKIRNNVSFYADWRELKLKFKLVEYIKDSVVCYDECVVQ